MSHTEEQIEHVVQQSMTAFMDGRDYVASWCRCELIIGAAGWDDGVALLVRTYNGVLLEKSAPLRLGPLRSLHIEMPDDHVRVFYREVAVLAIPFEAVDVVVAEELLDEDLPGMWTKADFEGGDPDERSYAERGWPT